MNKRFYIASWSGDKDRGIYGFDFDFETGLHSEVQRLAVIPNASYFARFGDILYVISEVSGPGDFAGILHSFKISDTDLVPIDSVSGVLSGAPHISVSSDGHFVFICSYDNGMTCSVETDKGTFGSVSKPVRIYGSSVVPGRQDSPHAHIMCPSPDGFVTCCDLGTDEIISYSYDAHTGQLSIVNRLKTPSGYGPRHMVFSQDGAYAYVVCELQYHLLVLSYHGNGCFELINDLQIIDSLPEGCNWGGAIKLDCDGELLFTSNRPDNQSSIDVFSLSRPDFPKLLSSANLCNHPRDFIQIVDESGKEYFMCLSMTDNLIRVFAFDRLTSSFSLLSDINGIPKPVCALQA